MSARVVTNTLVHLTRQDGQTLSLGEGQQFEIYNITGLGIGEVELDTTGNALMDGETWLGSRIINRVVEIESEWHTSGHRSVFTDFFQHNMRYDAEIVFNGTSYYGWCVLREAYDAEKHGGRLYSGSDIDVALYFPDPYFYTDTVYRYQIGYGTANNFLFYTEPEQHVIAFPPGPGLIHYFSLFREAQEYMVTNPSSTPNGIEAMIVATGEVINPGIRNITTGLFIQFRVTLVPGDELYINTQRGFIQATRNGQDIMRYLTLQSRMIQVNAGVNILLFDPDQGSSNAACEITFRGKLAAL